MKADEESPVMNSFFVVDLSGSWWVDNSIWEMFVVGVVLTH